MAARTSSAAAFRLGISKFKFWITFPGMRLLAALLLLFSTGSAVANSWTEDPSHYVSLGLRNGYYIVQPESKLFYSLGLFDAPWIDTADRLRHGYGADVLAFRFDRNGVLISPPAYVAQESPNNFYTARLGALARGRTTASQVEAMFGHGHSVAKRPDGFIYYYALMIYNPFEDWGSRR
jgi:hypothetical protein